MGISSVVAACFILLAFLAHSRASVVRTSDPGLSAKTQKFKLRIAEEGTNFDEQIEIDEDNDIEYFSVPAHNDVLAGDFLFDFKMNITITRLKDLGVCYLTPLPPELPKSNLLKKGLSEVTALPANQQIKKVAHLWKIDGEVDKTTLRAQVRDFCHKYPVYHLFDYTSESAAERLPERAKRQLTFDQFDLQLCGKLTPPCSPADWILRCKFTNSNCVYYMTCRVNVQRKQNECDTALHLSGRIMCCEARCP